MKHKIALLPIDNRPASYLLPQEIAEFSGIDLILPERDFLGNLDKAADLNYVENWLKKNSDADLFIIALDTWVYGSLVQSRKHNMELNILKEKTHKLKSLIASPIYGFSTVMRIPHYNGSDEEKDYWNLYGEKIYNWSCLMHRVGKGILLPGETHDDLLDKWYKSFHEVPAEILADYKGLRDKNFLVNIEWLNLIEKEDLDYLIFSCDDSGEYGLNVFEREYLKSETQKNHLSKKIKTISGTDEIPCVLLTKAMLEKAKTTPNLNITFSNDTGYHEISKYESGSIFDSLMNEFEALGLEDLNNKNSDLEIFIHVAPGKQGDHIFKDISPDTKLDAEKLIEKIEELTNPFILIDLAYANGSDPNLIDSLLKSKINIKNFYGYAGWNTSSNSIGSALSIGINRWLSERNNNFDLELFKKCIFTRLLDDYAYQSQIRHKNITEHEINDKIKPYAERISNFLELKNIKVEYKLPWKRSFEIEINVL